MELNCRRVIPAVCEKRKKIKNWLYSAKTSCCDSVGNGVFPLALEYVIAIIIISDICWNVYRTCKYGIQGTFQHFPVVNLW